MPIDYSKWDKLEISDDDSDNNSVKKDLKSSSAGKKANDSVPKKSQTNNKVHTGEDAPKINEKAFDPYRDIREGYLRLDPPEKKTQVRRMFEYDFENMTSSDWEESSEEIKLCSDRLDFLNEAYGIGETGFPTDLDINSNACRALFRDIQQNKEFWFRELFHPLECHQQPSNCERAAIALKFLSKLYFQKKKYNLSLSVLNTLDEVMECLRIQVFENRLITHTKKVKQRYRELEYNHHICRYNTTSFLGIRDKAVESCRRCAELELANAVNPFGKFVEILQPLSSSPPAFAKFASPQTLDFTKLCPICGTGDDLTMCPCGSAAYCSVEHKFTHWEEHKKYCKCGCCGSTKKLELCTGCLQMAFCGDECQKKFWPKHKAGCKRGQKRNPLHKKKPRS
jgi:hypothetical protein